MGYPSIRLTHSPFHHASLPRHTTTVPQRVDLIKKHLTALGAGNASTKEIPPISPRNSLLERSVSHKTLERRRVSETQTLEAWQA